MIGIEVAGALAVAVLATVATWMAIVGLLGVGGFVRMQRCRSCGHLVSTPVGRRVGACPMCSHSHLSHMVPAVHLTHLLPGELRPAAVEDGGRRRRHRSAGRTR
jgi:DNA-directed RNA polymerase subunit RPC12/RpoP